MRVRIKNAVDAIMRLGFLVTHPAFLQNAPRANIFRIRDGDDPLQTARFKTILEPGVGAFVAIALPPKPLRQVISDLDLARVFERLQTTGADQLARLF